MLHLKEYFSDVIFTSVNVLCDCENIVVFEGVTFNKDEDKNKTIGIVEQECDACKKISYILIKYSDVHVISSEIAQKLSFLYGKPVKHCFNLL